MHKSNKKHKEKLIKFLSFINDKNLIIFIISIFSRFYRLSTIPGTINRDEAFQGYNAYSLLKFGKDSYGKRFPVYLTVWGDGQGYFNQL